MMNCEKCNKPPYKCECPDIEERLEELKKNETIRPAIEQNIIRRDIWKSTGSDEAVELYSL